MEKVILMIDCLLEKSRRLKINLENNDYRVLITTDINDALMLLNANNVDLVITFDMNLDFERLKDSVNYNKIPIMGIFEEKQKEQFLEFKDSFDDYTFEPYVKDDLYIKVKNQIKISKLQKLVSIKENELKKAYEELNNFGLIDKITGLYNSFYFEHILKNHIASAKRYGYQLSGIIISVDNNFNDISILNQIQKIVTKIISENIRNNDIFVRLNLEHFYLLLPYTGLKDAVFVAGKLKKLVEDYKYKNNEKITISMGVTVLGDFESGMTKEEEMVKQAEEALKNAHSQGGDKIVCY